MDMNVDVHVCEPEVGINPGREAVFIQFQVMSGETANGARNLHTVLMRVQDAMRLLQTLSHIQKRFSLPEDASELAMIEISRKNN